jgi:hypothetical protein
MNARNSLSDVQNQIDNGKTQLKMLSQLAKELAPKEEEVVEENTESENE